jgi:uncharacterized membrane protein YsdA (DUF1294 family)
MANYPHRRPSKFPRHRAGPRFGVLEAFFLVGLLLHPALALRHFDPRWTVTCAFAVSTVTYFLYRHDKRQAQAEGWRTPESTLHLAELLGGWPGAFVAQRLLRHKSSKVSYQITFWLIVAAYQFLAYDYLHGWRWMAQLSALVLHQ